MAHINTMRHQQVFDAHKQNPIVTIIGAGATGSRIWLSLVELGLTNITIYDFDHIESHNLPNQIFLHSQIGMPKVEGLREYYKLKTGQEAPESMRFINEEITDQDIDGIVFLLTDTMTSRKTIFENCIQPHPGRNVPLMIETRMASSYGDVNTVNPWDENECKQWLDSLIDDDEAEASACGASITVGPTASIIANLAVWQFIHFMTNPVAQDPAISIHLKPMMLTLEAA